MPSGHIPNSLSLPFSSLVKQIESKDPRLNGESYTVLKDQTELWRAISDSVGGMEALDKLRQASSAAEPAVTATCGSGMSAAVIWAALQQLGITSALYDEVSSARAERRCLLKLLRVISLIRPFVSCSSHLNPSIRQSWMGWASRKESPIEKSDE